MITQGDIIVIAKDAIYRITDSYIDSGTDADVCAENSGCIFWDYAAWFLDA